MGSVNRESSLSEPHELLSSSASMMELGSSASAMELEMETRMFAVVMLMQYLFESLDMAKSPYSG